MGLTLENSAYSYLCFDWLYFTQGLTSFSQIDHLCCLYARFQCYFYLTWMRFCLSIHLLMCLFQDLNIHHSDWLIYSTRTERPGELCYNAKLPYSFPTCILECESHSPALLDFFLMLTMAFPLLGNPDHMVFSVSIDFLSNSKRDTPFHRIAHDYFCADWNSLCDHLGHFP